MSDVKLIGFKEFAKSLGASNSLIEKHGRDAILDSIAKIDSTAKANVTVDTGKLKKSIKHNLKRTSGEVVVDSKYGAAIEFGTRPHFPPVAPLEAWAKRKLGRSGLGFVVARKIAQKGTKAQPFFNPAINDSIIFLENRFRSALEAIIGKLTS